ncbi:MAG: hypothetical protein MHM6MM_000370 [Cercozoa sp. M6MM]
MSQDFTFEEVSASYNFADGEEQQLKYWDDINAFHEQLRRSEGRPPFTFYDGPPFATGLPHYGHILAGTIKDIVTRYATAKGFHVERRFGWDTHGLPVEHEINKKLDIKSNQQVLDMGIDVYNAECRAIVMRYSQQWEDVVKRVGRWIDFERDYKTMDISFMESVWHVFGQLWDKNLVYQGYKVMPFSTGLNTPLSNFEAKSNYKDVHDPSVVVAFAIKDSHDEESGLPEFLLAWTTTPWTLPSNLALCVNASHELLRIRDVASKKVFVVAQQGLHKLYGKKAKEGKHYQVLSKFAASEIVGTQYEPLFPYFADRADLQERGCWRVLEDDYVGSESGTGIVHQAPGFGEDDLRVCTKHGVVRKGDKVVCPVDDSGCFTEALGDGLAGKYIKEADSDIIALLKERGVLIKHASEKHSYPFCWRSETPLIYKAVESWFVDVEVLKDRLIANNKQTYWVPKHVQEGRFHNWLADARDWAISRNRFWGTPIPIWRGQTESGETVTKVVTSVAMLEQLAGLPVGSVDDLHRESIDGLVLTCPDTGAKLTRVDEVFDCWFESGSMPYAQQHYPFENKEKFLAGYPADFIAEGLDQTRGWFYTLMVLSTALFDKPAFKNLVVNGLVLAIDGKKMSKSKRNYPPPTDVISKYGADAVRLYLINSPVVRAESLKFDEKGVYEVVRSVFKPWFNAYRFLTENATRYENECGGKFQADLEFTPSNLMDRWLAARLQSLVEHVRTEMDAYRLYTVVPRLVSFIDELTNIYVRLNRSRLRGQLGAEEAHQSLQSLWRVLFDLSRLMAPFTPFLVEEMYLNLRLALPEEHELRQPSVHFLLLPEVRDELRDADLERRVARMQKVIDLGRKLRDQRTLSLKQPLAELRVLHPNAAWLDDVSNEVLTRYISEELSVEQVTFCNDVRDVVQMHVEPDRKRLGQRLGKKMRDVMKELKKLSHEQVLGLLESGSIEIAGEQLTREDLAVRQEFTGDSDRWASIAADDDAALLLLDAVVTPALHEARLAREFRNRVQRFRRDAGLSPLDKVQVHFAFVDKESAVAKSVSAKAQEIADSVRLPIVEGVDGIDADKLIMRKPEQIDDCEFEIAVVRVE